MLGLDPPRYDPPRPQTHRAAPAPPHRSAMFPSKETATEEAGRRAAAGEDGWTPVRLATGDWTIVRQSKESPPAEPTLPALDTDAAIERYAAVIRRIAREKRIPKRSASRRFAEMLKFLDVCALSAETVSPPPRVDDAWHAFLMFTRDYAAYCESRFGSFIHHDPAESPDPAAYERAYTEATERFGALDRRVWPRPRKDGSGGGGFGGFFGGGDGDGGGFFGDLFGCGGGGCGGGGCGGGS